MKNPYHLLKLDLHEFDALLEDLGVFSLRASQNQLTTSQSKEVITYFEKAHDQALKLIQKYLELQGKSAILGSRDLTVEAFHAELIDDGKLWLDMIIQRIQYDPLYSKKIEADFLQAIQKNYSFALSKFDKKMFGLLNEDQNL